jgi:hypothetical protein
MGPFKMLRLLGLLVPTMSLDIPVTVGDRIKARVGKIRATGAAILGRLRGRRRGARQETVRQVWRKLPGKQH